MVVESLVGFSRYLTVGGKYVLVSENDGNYVVVTDCGDEVGFSKGYFKDVVQDPFDEIRGWCFSCGIGEGDIGTLRVLVDRYVDVVGNGGVVNIFGL